MLYLVCSKYGGILEVLNTNEPPEEVEEKTIGANNGEFLVIVTDEDINNILNALGITKLKCPNPECNNEFLVKSNYEGVVTCPYCGKLVEQP
jgi:aspartate carbamoyltransferase regulatory subunit